MLSNMMARREDKMTKHNVVPWMRSWSRQGTLGKNWRNLTDCNVLAVYINTEHMDLFLP